MYKLLCNHNHISMQSTNSLGSISLVYFCSKTISLNQCTKLLLPMCDFTSMNSALSPIHDKLLGELKHNY